MAIDSPITLALFWSKVSVPENRVDCWEWTSTQNSNGYGRFWDGANGCWEAAHRLAYTLVKGEVPDELVVRHLCHNRLCCNPAHLAVGTAKDNAQDSIEAGRFTRGTVHGNSKLSDADVIAIRRNEHGLKTKELAERFGVSTGTISMIRNGKIWRHVAA